ncbi:MAG: protein BatD [candidate division Zixibacteria bacterium]|nr:protein BatD [candidate division Zixibacteria bacterium]
MTARVLLAVALAASFLSSPVLATTRLSADVQPKKIAINENATLRVVLESEGKSLPEPQLPPITDFQVFSSGRNQSITFVNGRLSSSVTHTYVLSPRSAGRFTIGPVHVQIGGVGYATPPMILTVSGTAGPVPSLAAPPAPGGRQDERAAARGSKRHVFITASLDKDTVYVNEPVTYIFRFYNAERLLSSPDYSRPSFTNFWVEDLPPQRKFSTVVDGVAYDVTEIRTALFPTDAGEKTIPAAEVKATVRSLQRPNPQDPFSVFQDPFFGGFGQGEDLHLATDALRLTVRPLPPVSAPLEATGLVGKFSIAAHTDVHSVNVGDPVTVSVTVSGEGNIKSIPSPQVDTIPSVRSFAGGTSEDVGTADYRVQGKKTFDQVFVPQRPGRFDVPSFALTYFDPTRRAYQTARTDSIPITVTGAAADFTIPSFKLAPGQISDLAADVRFLKTDSDHLRRAEDAGLFGSAFWAGHVFPLLGLSVLLGWRRRTLKEAADPVGRKRRRAYRAAVAQLQTVVSALAGPSSGGAVEAVHHALLNYYTDRFNCPAQGQTRAEMRATLKLERIAPAAMAQYFELLDDCDRRRYAPGQDGAEAAELATRARSVLEALETAS